MKYLYVTTISETINAFLIPHIKMLIDKGHLVDIACHVERPISNELIDLGCQVYDLPFSRSIGGNNYLQLSKMISKIVEDNGYDVIHTHTPLASAIVRFAVRKLKDIKIIYTAHGFHFFKGAPLVNWLTFYPVEQFLSRYTDIIITINNEDLKQAQKFGHSKVFYVPGVGFSIDKQQSNRNLLQDYKKEFKVYDDDIILLSVGELNENKNHETVIKSLADLKELNIKYIICGEGSKKEELLQLIKELKLEEKVILAGYRKDIPAIMSISDIFIFPSFREGLSVALMEAMGSGLAVICSDIRGNRDLIDDGRGGFTVVADNQVAFKEAITILCQDSHKRKAFADYNIEKVKNFSLEIVLEKLAHIYESLNV